MCPVGEELRVLRGTLCSVSSSSSSDSTQIFFRCRVAYTFSSTSTQTPLFSAFVSTSVALSYLLSRMSSNQHLMVVLFQIVTRPFCKRPDDEEEVAANEPSISTARDEMPKLVRKTVAERARYDLIFSLFLVSFFFGLHSTSLFTATQPYFTVSHIHLNSEF